MPPINNAFVEASAFVEAPLVGATILSLTSIYQTAERKPKCATNGSKSWSLNKSAKSLSMHRVPIRFNTH